MNPESSIIPLTNYNQDSDVLTIQKESTGIVPILSTIILIGTTKMHFIPFA